MKWTHNTKDNTWSLDGTYLVVVIVDDAYQLVHSQTSEKLVMFGRLETLVNVKNVAEGYALGGIFNLPSEDMKETLNNLLNLTEEQRVIIFHNFCPGCGKHLKSAFFETCHCKNDD